MSLDRSQAPRPAAIKRFGFPEIHRFKLSNALPVYFAQAGEIPVATLSLLLPAGALRESTDNSGLARLTTALLESGTNDLSAAEVSASFEGMGVNISTGTGWDISHVDLSGTTLRLPTGLELLTRLVREPAFPDTEVQRLKQQQLAAIVQRRAEPRGFANELAGKFIFAESSRYSRPVSGLSGTVADLSRDLTAAFHDAWFTPSDSGIVVAGKMDPHRLKDLLEGQFGDWKGPPVTQPAAVVAPRFATGAVIVVDRPGAVQSEVRVGHIGAARDTPDFFSILVMNTILGGAFSSRLNLNLRERNGFTYGARSSFAMRREPGPFLVSTAVETEVTGKAVAEIRLEMDRIRQDPVTTSELRDARQLVAGTYPMSLQTTDAIASRLAELFIYDLPDRYLSDFADQILAVTDDQVLRAARTYVRPDRAVIVVLGNAEKVRPQLEALNISEVQTVDSALLS